MIKKIRRSILSVCKKLKIKVTRRTKSGKRVPKTLKQLRKEIKTKKRNLKSKKNLFIQKANKKSIKKGTIGLFGKWCKSKKLTKDGKVTMRCINKALKSGNTTLIRRANYARNIGGYVGAKHTPKRTSFGMYQILNLQRDILLPRGSEWMDIREIYDDELLPHISELVQN
jgi:hypothetical protein